MFKKIPDTKTLEALLRAWHSKRAMTKFFSAGGGISSRGEKMDGHAF